MRDEIEHLLDDDMDMSEMYLTRKLKFQGFPETLSTVDSNKDAFTDHNQKYVIPSVARMRTGSKLLNHFFFEEVDTHILMKRQPIPHT